MPQPDGRGVTRNTADRRYALAPSVRLSPGATFMGIGDSITRGDVSGSVNSVYHGSSFLAQAAIRLGLRLVGNAGAAGEKSAAIRARVRSEVLPLRPQLCHVMVGTNNCGDVATDAGSLNDALADTVAICETLRSNGIIPVLGALPPRPSTAIRAKDGLTVAQATATLRRMQMEWARSNGVIFVPYHEALAGPSNGYEAWGAETLNGASASFSVDGIHPTSPTGVHAMGQKLAEVIAAELPTSRSYAWESGSIYDDPLNMIGASSVGGSNARGWLVDTDESGYPDGWTSSGTTMSGQTSSMVTEGGVRWWRLQIPTTSSGDISYLYSASAASASPRGWSSGDRLLMALRLRTSGCRSSATSGLKLNLFVQYSASGGKVGVANGMCIDVDPGLVMTEFSLPSATDRVYFFLAVSTFGTRSIASTVEFARPALWNLTRLGL